MADRDFEQWLKSFTDNINNWNYYVNYDTAYKNTASVKRQLALLNTLKGSENIEDEFRDLGKRYWGQHLWARGYFCATVGSVTKDMIQEYIEKQFENGDKNHFKVES